MNYILFDPAETWEDLLPLTWTRPISEIRVGILTIREKWEKHLGTTVSWLTRDFLRELFPVNLEEDNILINGSILPDPSVLKTKFTIFIKLKRVKEILPNWQFQ